MFQVSQYADALRLYGFLPVDGEDDDSLTISELLPELFGQSAGPAYLHLTFMACGHPWEAHTITRDEYGVIRIKTHLPGEEPNLKQTHPEFCFLGNFFQAIDFEGAEEASREISN